MASYQDLRVIVIGAGMGGLGCALSLAKNGFRHVDVYETASNLGFVGAGIQMAPNMARILDRLGCWAEIEREATNVKETSIRQGSTNEELAHVAMPDIAAKYGYPHCVGHRSTLAGSMYNACKAEPAITFHFATAVERIVRWAPKPRLLVSPRGGGTREVEADVVLAADGIKSAARAQMLARRGEEAEEEDTGQACYRIMLTRKEMAAAGDPELLRLMDADLVVRWIGEKRHIIAYPVAGKSIYNLSSTQPDVNFAAAPSATYTTRGSKEAMLRVFGDFCPLVTRMLDMVPDGEVCEWKLRQHRTLSSWCDGAVALLGDACHPTLPHIGQGAAMAIEDGAVLAEVLSRVSLPQQTSKDTNDGGPLLSGQGSDPVAAAAAAIHRCLKAYESLRKERTAVLVDLAALSGRALHLGEGKAKEERDRQFAAARAAGAEKNAPVVVPDKWASADVQNMIYSHDCVKYAADNFDRVYAAIPEA